MSASTPPVEKVITNKELLESCKKIVTIAGGIPPQFSRTPFFKRSASEPPASGPIGKWVYTTFTIESRNDGLQLKHWQKEGAPYPYSNIGKKLEIIKYTDEEYNELIADINPSWSKEETDILFELCERFELRFIVIADRFSQYLEYKRSIEELKDRYFSIAKRLLEKRGNLNNQLVKKPFNLNYEVRRKINLEKIFLRTADHQAFERQILEEVKKNEQNIKKEEREQRNLKRLMSKNPESDIISNKKPFNVAVSSEKEGMETEENESGAYLRSKLMNTPLPIPEKAQKKLDQILKELGVPEKLPPTEAVVKVYDQLRKEILIYLGLDKHVKKKDSEKKVLEEKYEDLQKRLKNAQMVSSQGVNRAIMHSGNTPSMLGHNGMQFSPNVAARIQPIPNHNFVRYPISQHLRTSHQYVRAPYENEKTDEGSVPGPVSNTRAMPVTCNPTTEPHPSANARLGSEPSPVPEPNIPPTTIKPEVKHEQKTEVSTGKQRGKRKPRSERKGKRQPDDSTPDDSSEKKKKKY